MNVIVTGAAGFIGFNLINRLLKENHRVIGIDNFFSGSALNIKKLSEHPLFSFKEIDLADDFSYSAITDRCDAVIHLAADVSVQRSIDFPDVSFNQNVSSTLNILKCVEYWNPKCFLFSSSCAVYGDSDVVNREGQLLPKPKSVYALSKSVCEDLIELMIKPYSSSISMRFFNIYGPHQNVNSDYGAVIPIWINNILREENLKVFGDGLQTRDFVFIDDLCAIISKLLSHAIKEPRKIHEVVNIGTGKSVPILEVANSLQRTGELFDSQMSKIEFNEKRTGDVVDSTCSNEKLCSLIGKPEFTPLDLGLKQTFNYFLEANL